VLESVNPAPSSGYSRVHSWIDNESGGVLQAEAFDANGKLLKKFSVGSVEKVNGRWRISNIRMRNARTGQTTELKFQHPPDTND
jgi:negative regulator of sigma E activity